MSRPSSRFRALPLFLVLIPIFFCALLYRVGSDLYIPALNFYVSHSTLSYGALVWSFMWVNLTAFRVICRKHILSEIAFYVFPAAVPALLIFAQWHFVAALLLLAGAIAACVLIAIRLSPRNPSPARFGILTRCFVSVCAAILLVPTAVSMFGYNLRSPTYSVSQQILASLAEDQASAALSADDDIFSSSGEMLLQFSPEYWDEHTLEEKVFLVQQLVGFECQRFGIPVVSVTAEALDSDVLGSYRHSLNRISVNTAFLDLADPVDVIFTVTHESHHAYAAWICTNTDFSDPVTDSLLFAQVRAWRDNSNNYVSASLDYDGYLEQPIERDANLWAEEETARIQACWPEE